MLLAQEHFNQLILIPLLLTFGHWWAHPSGSTDVPTGFAV
jgi:hypothetical protein